MVHLTIYSIVALLLFILSTYTDAEGDAHIDETGKRHHGLEFTVLASMVFGVLVSDLWWISSVMLIVLVRFLLFDYFYNRSRGLPSGFIGSTSKIDKFFKKYRFWVPMLKVFSIFAIIVLLTFDFRQLWM